MTSALDDLHPPGRLPVRVALRYLPRSWLSGWTLIALASGAAVGRFWTLTPQGRAIAIVLAVPLVIILTLIRSRDRPGILVTRENQPALFALVAEVAAHGRLRPPRRIWLTGEAEIEVRAAPRLRDLRIGLPLLSCLAESEVRALVGHELALLQHRHAWLVVHLIGRWTSAVDFRPEERDAQQARVAAELGPLAVRVHLDADRAASAVSGGHAVAARAFAVSELALSEYRAFRYTTTGPDRATTAITDTDDGWRRYVARRPRTYWYPGVAADLARRHPDLAMSLRDLGGQEIRLAIPEHGVRLEELGLKERRLLARSRHDSATGKRVTWYDYASTPPAWWQARAAEEAADITRDVAAVLGREPADTIETAEIVAIRYEEILAFYEDEDELPDDEAAPRSPDQPYDPPPMIAALVEDTLLRRGWRLEHPAVRGVLIGPAGERADVQTLVTGTVAEPNLDALRALLRG